MPIVSALLAHGAVVYTQRREVQQKQATTLRQTFALADRGWMDISLLWNAHMHRLMSSKYLWLAAGLLALSMSILSSSCRSSLTRCSGAIQQPIQQALVTTETIPIMTCANFQLYNSSKSCSLYPSNTIVAYDPEPYDLARIPRDIVVRETVKRLTTSTDAGVQLYLWNDPSANQGRYNRRNTVESKTFYWYNEHEAKDGTYFVSALPNNTPTGVLREHAIRINSTVQCENLARSDFPKACNGPHPFPPPRSNDQGALK